MAANISKQFSPRRGARNIMTDESTLQSQIVLAAGELFVEYPEGGVGTGACKIKIGDGVTPYIDLEYAIENDASGAIIDFDPNTESTVAGALDDVVSGAANGVLIAALKQAVTLLNGEAIKSITLDQVQAIVTNNAVTLTTPDYTIAPTTVSGGAAITLSPSSGRGKSDSSFNIKSTDSTIGVTVTNGAVDLSIGSITGAASTIISSNLDTDLVLVSTSAGKVGVSDITTTELGYLDNVTSNIQAQLNGKSDTTHNHDLDDLTGSLDVSKLWGGTASNTIAVSLLPKAALGDFVVVANQEARLALTIADVQNGDVVKQNDTGVLYYVKDETKLAPYATPADAFEEFKAGSAASVAWTDVTGKPGDFQGATSAANGSMGFVPQPDAGDEGKYLCGNGSWVDIAAFTGATSAAAGAKGFVPAPAVGDEVKYLRGDGTWAGNATSAVAGLMSAADKENVDYLSTTAAFDFGDETP